MIAALLTTLPLLVSSDLGRWIETYDSRGGAYAVAAGPDGSVATLDGDAGRIHMLSNGDTFDLSPILHQPRGLALRHDGVMLVADTGHHRVMFFDIDGSLLGGCGGRGDEDYHLRFPMDVDASDNHMVVADAGNHRVQIYTPNGKFIRSIGGAPGDPLRRPEGIAIDEEDRIWVADTHNHRVVCFTVDGTELMSIGSWGTFPGQFMEPSGIDVRKGRVIVTDRLNHRVQIFDSGTGELIETWGMHAVKPRQGEGRVHYPSDAAILTSGDVIIAEPFEERIQRFGTTGADIDPPQPAPRGVQSHFGPVAATDGRFFCTWEPELRAIHLFTLDRKTPIRITTFGEPGTAPGQIGHVTAIAIDEGLHRIWAVDAGNARIHEWRFDPPPPESPGFDPAMATLSRSVPLKHAGEGSLVRTTDGLFFIDRTEGRALAINRDGQHKTVEIPVARDPVAVALSNSKDSQRFAVLDAAENVIHLMGDWPGTQSHESTVKLQDVVDPVDLAVAADNSLIVVDRGGHQLLRYSPDGQELTRWGSRGTDHGTFWRPAAVVVDEQNRVIVLDHGNHRAQMFDIDGSWIMTFGTGRAWTRSSNEPAVKEME